MKTKEPITLSHVILKLPSELYYYKRGDLLFIAKSNQEPKEQITWNLRLERLEEQSKETQKAITNFKIKK